MVPEDAPKIGRRVSSRNGAASYQPSASYQRGKTLGPAFTADAVNDYINAALVRQISYFSGDLRKPSDRRDSKLDHCRPTAAASGGKGCAAAAGAGGVGIGELEATAVKAGGKVDHRPG